MEGKKILITGPTGQVAEPVVAAWAPKTDLYAMARFNREADIRRIEALGAHCLKVDLADPMGLEGVPDDFDYVLNFAVVKSGEFDYDLAANAEGLGRLMLHCRRAQAFLHLSSTAVYEYAGQKPLPEDAPLGDNHRVMFPTYSISKIAAETVCRFVARQFDIPTTIARLSVPYGDNGGWPFFHLLMMEQGIPIEIHPEGPNYYNLLHVDDYLEKLPRLLAVASSDPTTVNFGGSDKTSIEEWCDFLSELTGLKPEFKTNPKAFGSLTIDVTRMHELIGSTQIPWREGIRSQVEALAPHLLKVKGGTRSN
ncbi:MAG: NAD(P)-dependent oxidoreductase [Halieaceae bacterium]|nr:NAD(P)-dependent oxidoreductase [Halieaceae bacterium]